MLSDQKYYLPAGGSMPLLDPDEVTNQAPDRSQLLKLGEICDRLGFKVTAHFLEERGILPVARLRTAQLYPADSFPLICQKIIEHVQTCREEGGKVAA